MSEIINELMAERDALRNRLEKIETAIQEYERWTQSAADLVGARKALTGNDLQISATTQQTPVAEFEKAVLALFERSSRPLKRTEVYDALTNAGVVVGGKDPLNTVASRLSRIEGVTNLKGHGYWAAERPYPPAEYPGDSAAASGPVEANEAQPDGDFFSETERATDKLS